MRYLFFTLLLLLAGCKEKSLTPIGQEYLLVDSEIPMPITLGFNPDGRFYGKAVNDYWGQYHIHDDIISFSGITNTMKSDTLPRMQAERKYFDNLTNSYSFKIIQDELHLLFDENKILIFQKVR